MIEWTGMNYWAIAVAWLVITVVGAIWYSPVGFAKQWKELTGVDILQMPDNEPTKVLASVVVASLVQAVLLAVVINSLDASTLGDGLMAGVILWAGFIGASTVGSSLYARQGWRFWALNSGYYLIVIVVGGGVLAAWG